MILTSYLSARNLELAWQQIDVLITDNELSAEQKQAIEAKGVQVICAEIA